LFFLAIKRDTDMKQRARFNPGRQSVMQNICAFGESFVIALGKVDPVSCRLSRLVKLFKFCAWLALPVRETNCHSARRLGQTACHAAGLAKAGEVTRRTNNV